MLNEPRQHTLTACPVCASDDIEDLGLDETYFIRPFQKTLTTRTGHCQGCGFVFHINPLDEESLGEYYLRNAQLRTRDRDSVEDQVHAGQAGFVAGRGSLKGKRVLEIGANTGKFLDHLRRHHGCETYFDELNAEARKLLIETSDNRPMEDLDDAMKFDVVVMRHVLEHIVDPIRYLSGMRDRVADDGVLFVEVPDFSFLDRHTDTLLFEHVNYFSHSTLSRVLDGAGFIPLAHEFSITEDYITCSDRVLRMLAGPKPAGMASGVGEAMRSHQHERVGKTTAVIERLIAEAGEKTRVAFYAASWWTERALLNGNFDVEKVIAIFDKDEKKQGQLYNGIKVHPPEDIADLNPDMIFVLTSFEPQIKRDLKKLNYQGAIYGWSDLLAMSETS